MHPLAKLVLIQAQSFLGQMESPANSNRHPSVTWYNKMVENLGLAWNYCAAGVTREFYEVLLARPLVRPRAYVPWMMQDFIDGANAKAGGKLLWVDSDLDNVMPGDVVFYDWTKATNPRRSVWAGDHVGVVESLKDRRSCYCIEHNTSVPGTNNQGVARKLRDAKFIVAVGRPGYATVATAPSRPPTTAKIPGTTLLPLDADGELGPKSIIALSTVMAIRHPSLKIKVKDALSRTSYEPLTAAIQIELNAAGQRDANGKKLVVDGIGFGSNSGGRFPSSGSARTIQAMQIGHGVSAAKADGYFSAKSSSEVARIQRDVNLGGTNDSPFFNG